jgi:hypothetical protein
MSVKNVVSQNQGHPIARDEFAIEQESLRQSPRVRLDTVGDLQAQTLARPQQTLEATDVLGGGDQQDLTDSRQHQGRQRVVDHGLVIDRQQLLADRPGHRVQPGPRATRQDDPLVCAWSR